MPISPDMAETVARGVLGVYEQAERELLETVAKRLLKGIDQPGWAEAKLADIASLRRETEALVSRMAEEGIQAAEEALAEAHTIGQRQAATDLSKLETGIQGQIVLTNTETIEAFQRVLADRLQATHLRVLRWTQDAYRSVIGETASQVAAGTQTRRVAAQRALDAFASRGVTGFVDTAGRSWDLTSYAEMATRSSSGQAAIQGHVDTLSANGMDLVIISDAPEECSICRDWEGKVLSISGDSRSGDRLDRGFRVDGTLSEAISAGLFHANCRHSTAAYVPGLTTRFTNTKDPEGDRQRQEQRYLERGLRQWKRRQAAALTPDAQKLSQAKVREWRNRLENHVETHDRQRLRYREGVSKAR